MPATQHDVARLAGVSQAIVSDVLRNRPRGRVHPETRRRIFDAARQLGYRPNAAARALRERCSRQVSYLASHPDPARLGLLGEEIVGGAAARLAEAGLRLTIEPAVAAPGDPGPLLDRFGTGASDGAILRAVDWAPGDWERLAGLPNPVVVVGQCEHAGFTSVAHDAGGIVREAVAALRRRGHFDLALLSNWERGDYFEQVRTAWSAAARHAPPPVVARTATEGARVAAGWAAAPDPPTGVLCYSLEAALSVHRARAARGMRLGEDYDLVAVGAAEHAWALPPGMLFLGTSLKTIGTLAADALLATLEGRPGERRIRLMPELRIIEAE